MYENQISCWLEKQREASYLVSLLFSSRALFSRGVRLLQTPGQFMTHELSSALCQRVRDGDTIGANYEFSDRGDTKKKDDDLLLTRSRFMHTNVPNPQDNSAEEDPKRNMDHAEELESLKGTINDNDEAIRQLESQLQKMQESITKVSSDTSIPRQSIDPLFVLVRSFL